MYVRSKYFKPALCIDDESSAVNANPFPEPEIDDIRVLKDAELLRYVQVRERLVHTLHPCVDTACQATSTVYI